MVRSAVEGRCRGEGHAVLLTLSSINHLLKNSNFSVSSETAENPVRLPVVFLNLLAAAPVSTHPPTNMERRRCKNRRLFAAAFLLLLSQAQPARSFSQLSPHLTSPARAELSRFDALDSTIISDQHDNSDRTGRRWFFTDADAPAPSGNATGVLETHRQQNRKYWTNRSPAEDIWHTERLDLDVRMLLKTALVTGTTPQRDEEGRIQHSLAGNQKLALDLGCGDGYQAVGLAEEGWHVIAVDLEETIFEVGRQMILFVCCLSS